MDTDRQDTQVFPTSVEAVVEAVVEANGDRNGDRELMLRAEVKLWESQSGFWELHGFVRGHETPEDALREIITRAQILLADLAESDDDTAADSLTQPPSGEYQ